MKKEDLKKVALIGTGFVGMSFAYALLNSGECDQLVLIDINTEKAKGEAMDLNHGLPFAKRNMLIYAGDYNDCYDADIVVIAAGVAQKEGEDRISLLKRNYEVFKSIINPDNSYVIFVIMSTGFVATRKMPSKPLCITGFIMDLNTS